MWKCYMWGLVQAFPVAHAAIAYNTWQKTVYLHKQVIFGALLTDPRSPRFDVEHSEGGIEE